MSEIVEVHQTGDTMYNSFTCIISTTNDLNGWMHTVNGCTYVVAGSLTRGPFAEMVIIQRGTRGRYQVYIVAGTTVKSADGRVLGSFRDHSLLFFDTQKWTTKRRASHMSDSLCD